MFIEQACQILGVNMNDADLERSAKKAYRNLAKDLHPDKTGNSDTADQFSQVTDAYNAVNEFIKNPTVQQPAFSGFNVTAPNGWNVSVQNGTVHQTVDQNGTVHFTIDFW